MERPRLSDMRKLRENDSIVIVIGCVPTFVLESRMMLKKRRGSQK